MLELVPLVLTVLTLAGYGAGLSRLRRRGDSWPASRTACLAAGSLCVAAAVLPPVSSHEELFPVHIGQHLLLGMTGPAFLALSAPVTLALRTLSRRPRRLLLRVLHSRPAAAASAPATAVILNLGGMYALYLTGLYRAAQRDDLVHAAVHMHMFLAGCLISWAIIGVDPVRRPGVQARLVALIIAGAGHDTLAKLIYARNLPVGGGALTDRHTGAELMYYGGTVIDLVLAVIVMTQWYQSTGRELDRRARRSVPATSGAAPAPADLIGRPHAGIPAACPRPSGTRSKPASPGTGRATADGARFPRDSGSGGHELRDCSAGQADPLQDQTS
jgi:putative membrane protein